MKLLTRLAAFLFSLGLTSGWAVTQGLSSISGVVEDQNIVASSPSQDHVAASVQLAVAGNNLQLSDAANLRVRFYLVDQDGVNVTLDLGGSAGTYVELTRGVSYPTGTVQSGLSWASNETFNASLKPLSSTRLRTGDLFKVKVRVAIDDGNGYGPESVYQQATAQTIWHFTSTDPNDASPNTSVRLGLAILNGHTIIRSLPSQSGFKVHVYGKARRFDNFAAGAPSTGNVTVPYRLKLHDLTAAVDVPLLGDSFNGGVTIPTFVEGATRSPAEADVDLQVEAVPQDWTDINPLHNYSLEVDVGHAGDAMFSLDSAANTAVTRWAAFTGVLKFGSFIAGFNQVSTDLDSFAVSSDPAAVAQGTIRVPAGHGTIPNHSNLSFGNSNSVPVKMLPNGDLIFIGSDSYYVMPPNEGDFENVHGLAIYRNDLHLSATGATVGTLRVTLPRGLSVSRLANTRRLKRYLTFEDVALNANLLPTQVTTPVAYFVALERLPLVFGVPGITVNLTNGQLSFTPGTCAFDTAGELALLEAYATAPTPQIELPFGKLLHAGNDQIFRLARTTSGDTFIVTAGSDGAAFINSLRLTFDQGAYWTHFPRALAVSAAAPDVYLGQFLITNDKVDSTSQLRGADVSFAYYDPNNPTEPNKSKCNGATPAPFRGGGLAPANDRLIFRPDGSLSATVSVNSQTSSLRWGIAKNSPLAHTQTMSLASTGKLMIPGHFLPWRDADVADVPTDDRTATLQLAGRNSTGALQWEVPGTNGYTVGDLDYAGVNLRASDASNPTGVTIMGGMPTPSYPLRSESKFYIRQSGVSGTVQSDQNFSLLIYGMQMDLEGVKLAYLSNLNVGSLLGGGLNVGGPYPANATQFNLTFDGLKLFSDGSLDRGTLRPNQGQKPLTYWNANFTPRSMEFKQPDPCDASNGFLVLGVETQMLGLGTNETLHGVLGFRGADGSLIARGDPENQPNFTGIDSRLIMPGNIKIKGPGTSDYTCTPVCGAYFNKWPGTNATGGFQCIAGSVDVPFFENLNAHIHGEQRPPAISPTMFLMSPPASSGPFDLTHFDPSNLGYPDGVAGDTWAQRVGNYRSSSDYALHAKKSWLGLLNFDYPLQWDATLRQFKMTSDIEQNVIVADVKSRVRTLTPTTADIKFKAKLGLDLPSINTSELIGGALDGIGASNVLDSISIDVPGFGEAMKLVQEFEEALADTPEKLVRQPLINVIHEVRNPGPSQGGPTVLGDFRMLLIQKLADKFSDVAPAVPNPIPTGWKDSVFTKLDKAKGAADTINGYLSDLNTVLLIANAAASVVGGENSSVVPDSVSENLTRARSLLSDVSNGVTKIKTTVNAIDLTIPWANIINDALPDAPSFVDPFPEKTDEQIADMILLQFLGSSSAGLMGEQMRMHLSNTRDSLRSGLDEAFSGINDMMQNSSGDVPFAGAPGIPDMKDLQFGKVDGYARINGDSLHELRLDADINISTGTDFKMHGYVLFKDVQSDTPQGACRASQGVAAELTLGASTTAKLGSPVPPALTVVPSLIEAEAKFAFDNQGDLNGIAGRLGMSNPEGALFGIVKLQQAEFGFGFGGGDAYLYGKGAGKTDLYDIEAALYFGRSCDLLSVMQRVDAQAAELLATSSFDNLLRPSQVVPAPLPVYGFYAFGYGAVSVTALLGIPPTCMLNLKAGAGMGAFGFFRENNLPGHAEGDNYFTTVGLRQDFGVSGEVLCVADISARLSLIGAFPAHVKTLTNLPDLLLEADTFTGNGKANVKVSLGVSPFKVKVSKTLDMSFSYKPLKFDLDF